MPMMPLVMVPEGKECRVVSINGGRGSTRRLIELGFGSNVVVKVVKSMRHGPLIVQMNDSRFALGRGMAMKIMVDET